MNTISTHKTAALPAALAGARIGVVGLGRTGLAVVDVLTTYGAQVAVFDSRPDAAAGLPAGISKHVKVTVGSQAVLAQAIAAADLRLLVVSPGISPQGEVFAAAKACGIEIWSEIELAWRIQALTNPGCPWFTVTGTDGKTTTVAMLREILSAAGLRVAAVGNIGVPALRAVADEKYDALAVELSSFQLHTTHTLSAWAAACLNLSADHLNWHGTMENYAADKARIYNRARRGAIYNCDDIATEHMVEQACVADGCRAIGFGLSIPARGQLGVVDDALLDRAWCPQRQTQAQEIATFADLAHLAPGGEAAHLPPHIVADALAAAALALSHEAVAADPSCIARGLRAVAVGEHRIVTVAQAAGITWIDDSKATNPHSARAALTALPPGSGVWIVGGDTKGADLQELVADVRAHLRAVVVIGADPQPVLAALAVAAPQIPHTVVPAGAAPAAIMEQAVRASAQLARSGDTVILAPAAASWDQFCNYGQRGDMFAQAVRRYLEGTDVRAQGVN